MDGCVFASLANGDVLIFQRNSSESSYTLYFYQTMKTLIG